MSCANAGPAVIVQLPAGGGAGAAVHDQGWRGERPCAPGSPGRGHPAGEGVPGVAGGRGWVSAPAELGSVGISCAAPRVTSLIFLITAKLSCKMSHLLLLYVSRVSPFPIPTSSIVFPGGGLGNTCVV